MPTRHHIFLYYLLTFLAFPDLSSLFNWNTKQVFVYITASYPSSSPGKVPDSEAIVWDAIIPSNLAPWHQNTYIHPTPKKTKTKTKAKKKTGKAYPAGTEPGIIRLSEQKPKYQITDYSGKMAERSNATLTLHWNVQPWVGALVWTNKATIGRWTGLEGGEAHFDFPALKGGEVKKEDLKTEKGGERNRGMPA